MDFTQVDCPVCNKKFVSGDDVVVCPECGTPHHRECYKKENRCFNSDKHQSGFVFPMPEITKDSHPTNEAPEAEQPPIFPFGTNGSTNEPLFQVTTVEVAPDQQIDGIPAGEIEAYVGSNARRYVMNFLFLDKFKKAKPNLAAFFFSYIWLFYRKMYKLGVIFIAATIAISLCFTNQNTINYTKAEYQLVKSYTSGEITFSDMDEKLSALESGNSYYFDVAPSILSMVLRLVLALFANKWYAQKMKKDVLAARKECEDMPSYLEKIRKKGGVSVAAAVLSAVGVFMLQSLISFALINIF